MASHVPRAAPWLWRAIRAYSEQVGAKRQLRGRYGDTTHW